MIVLKDIETKTFDKAFVGGYNPNEVDKFLDEIYDSFKSVCEDNENLKEKIVILAKKVEEYRNDEENIKNALLDAQKLKSSIKDEIEKQNSDIIEKAKAEAENIINNAKKEAEKILSSASETASVEKADLHNKILFEEEKFEEIKNTVHNFKKQIFDLYKEHLELLNKIPSVEESKDLDEKPEESTSENINNENKFNDASEEIISESDEISVKPEQILENQEEENTMEIQSSSDEIQPSVEEVSEKLYKDEIKVENLKFGVDYDIDNDFDDDDEYMN